MTKAEEPPEEQTPATPDEPVDSKAEVVESKSDDDNIEAIVDRLFESGTRVVRQAREEGVRPIKKAIVTYANKLVGMVEGISDGITGDRKGK